MRCKDQDGPSGQRGSTANDPGTRPGRVYGVVPQLLHWPKMIPLTCVSRTVDRIARTGPGSAQVDYSGMARSLYTFRLWIVTWPASGIALMISARGITIIRVGISSKWIHEPDRQSAESCRRGGAQLNVIIDGIYIMFKGATPQSTTLSPNCSVWTDRGRLLSGILRTLLACFNQPSDTVIRHRG